METVLYQRPDGTLATSEYRLGDRVVRRDFQSATPYRVTAVHSNGMLELDGGTARVAYVSPHTVVPYREAISCAEFAAGLVEAAQLGFVGTQPGYRDSARPPEQAVDRDIDDGDMVLSSDAILSSLRGVIARLADEGDLIDRLNLEREMAIARREGLLSNRRELEQALVDAVRAGR
jgi:hypothetical protein